MPLIFDPLVPLLKEPAKELLDGLDFDAVLREKLAGEACTNEEAINTPFCPLQEKFHTFVSRGLRNISEAP